MQMRSSNCRTESQGKEAFAEQINKEIAFIVPPLFFGLE